MTTMRCDVIVLGSTVSALVAGAYLARAGLRVVLIEEDVHAKRAPLLREPFLLSGLESDGLARRVLREIALPLREQQEIEARPVAVQVVTPEARLDVYPEARDLAHEVAIQGLATVDEVMAWIADTDAVAEPLRAGRWQLPEPRVGGRAIAEAVRTLSRARHRARAPSAPDDLARSVEALVFASTPGDPGPQPESDEGAALVSATRRAVFRMPDAGSIFPDLFRRRLRNLFGEIHTVEAFQIRAEKGEVEVELSRGAFRARALVVGTPREPLRRMLAQAGRAPDWLVPETPPVRLPYLLCRAESRILPVGMQDRVVVQMGGPESRYWIARIPEAKTSEVEWIVMRGPGLAGLPPENPLAELAPFGQAGLLEIDPGPEPQWDVDGPELRFPTAGRQPRRPRTRVVFVGAETAPRSGFEGELLAARRAALQLAQKLCQRSAAVAFHRAI